MASRQEKGCNLITVTVLFNELKASGSDLRFVYYFVVEWQNGAEGARERGWMFLLWKPSTALAVVFLICTLLGAHLYFHPFPLRECYSAWQNEREEGGVWETPWQVGRHKDSTLLIIDGGKTAHWMSRRATLGGCEYKCVCVSVYLCVQENQKNKTKPKTMLRENGTKQKKWWGARLEVLGEESIEWWQWYLVKTH